MLEKDLVGRWPGDGSFGQDELCPESWKSGYCARHCEAFVDARVCFVEWNLQVS